MRSLRVILLILHALSAIACEQRLAVDISIQGANPSTDLLIVNISYGPPGALVGVPEQRLALGGGRLWAWLPSDAHGNIMVEVRAQSAAGCALGKGAAQSIISTPVTVLDVPLQGALKPSCPVTVVRSGGQAGVVRSDPAGIDCGEACTGYFSSSVSLLAEPGPYAPFQRLSGCDGGSSVTCTLTDLTRPRTVTAEFGELCARGGACQDTSPTTEDLNAVSGTGPSDIWAVGNKGTVVQFDGREWKLRPTDKTCSLRAVSAPRAGVVWAVGDSNCVLRWNGTGWDDLSPALPRGPLFAISSEPDESQTFAGGPALFGRIDTDPDGFWSTRMVPRVVGLARVASGHFEALTSEGNVHEWRSETGAWTWIATGITSSAAGPRGLVVDPVGDLWTLDDGSSLLRGKGGVYSAVPCGSVVTGAAGQLRGLWPDAGSRVWMVGTAGRLLACEVQTATAQAYPVPVAGRTLYGVWGAPGGDVIAVGAGGTIFRLLRK